MATECRCVVVVVVVAVVVVVVRTCHFHVCASVHTHADVQQV